MRKSIIFMMALLLILLIGCQQKTQDIVCNEPYILVGTDCCLDEDGNKICDKDETNGEPQIPKENFLPKTTKNRASNFILEDEETFKIMSSEHCFDEYPSDFRMRAYCEGLQIDGYDNLLREPIEGMSQSDFEQIIEHCFDEYPSDFRMRAYCEGLQIEGWESLN